MSRKWVWASVAFLALLVGLWALVSFWPASALQGVAVTEPAPSTPASANAHEEPAHLAGSPPDGPRPGDLRRDGSGAATTPEERRAEHARQVEEHRKATMERVQTRRTELEQRRAVMQAQRDAYEATRPPDPNRPAPHVAPLHLGPALVQEQQNQP